MTRLVSWTNRWLLARLGRVTSSGRLIPEIDGLRFVAIMAVLMFHLRGGFFPTAPDTWGDGNFLSRLTLSGWFGVQLFFIISGFILSMPFAEQRLLDRRPVSLKKYFIRRLTRLEPPYIIALVVLAIMQLWNGRDLGEMLPHLGASLVYMHNVFYNNSMEGMVDHVTWSLEVEVQFYVLAPLLASVFSIRSVRLRRAVLAAGIAASMLQSQWWPSHFLGGTFLGQARYFLIGFVLSDLWLTEWKSRPAKGWAWDAIGLPAWCSIPFVLTIPTDVMPGPLSATLLLTVCGLAYVAAFRERIVSRVLSLPWIVAIGGMCYTIYLYHVPFMWWVRQIVAKGVEPGTWAAGDFVRSIVLTALVLLAVSAVLFVLFEKPFMYRDWPARLAQWVRGRGMAAPPLPEPVPVESSAEPIEAGPADRA